MGIEDFPTNENPPKEGTEIVNGEKETEKEVGEAEIETEEKTELTGEGGEEIKEKLGKVEEKLEVQGEKLEQEEENLSGEQRKVVEGLVKRAKEGFEKVGHYLKDLIKDYRYTEISMSVLVADLIAYNETVGKALQSVDTVPMTLSGAVILSIFVGSEISALVALGHEHKKRKERK